MMSDAVHEARRLVEAYLEASMIPDPVKARTFVAPDVRITFTGGRRFGDPGESSGFNAKRYGWVKKRFEHTHVVAGGTMESAVVYNTGSAKMTTVGIAGKKLQFAMPADGWATVVAR